MIKYPIGKAEGGRAMIGTCLTIQGEFFQVFSALMSYFTKEFKFINYRIVTMLGGNENLLTASRFVIMKTKTPVISSGQNSSGNEQSEYDEFAKNPVPSLDIINKDFFYYLMKACNNFDFNTDLVNEKGFKIRDYFCKVVHG